MATVSIIIPCFNAIRWIPETLNSVLSQRGTDIETIAIDDGSTDGTSDAIRLQFPNVRVIRCENRGPSHARNLGTRASSGQFVQYLDADDLLAPNKIALQMQALEEQNAEIAYGDWQRLVTSGDSFVPGEIVARHMRTEPEIELFGDFWCPPAAYLFRRSIVEAVGQWNERLPIIQDARFALDCALRGGKFAYTPGVVAHYRVHASGSVSTRDPIGFVRDCLTNALEIEAWWNEHGGNTSSRHQALLKAYGYVARASFESDPDTFELAYSALERLKPGYVPDHPRRMAVLAKVFNYRRAEGLASRYRKMKAMLS